MKTMKTALFTLVLVLLLTASALAETNITLWHSMSEEAGALMDEFVQEFNETVGKEAGIHVEAVFNGPFNAIGGDAGNRQRVDLALPRRQLGRQFTRKHAHKHRPGAHRRASGVERHKRIDPRIREEKRRRARNDHLAIRRARDADGRASRKKQRIASANGDIGRGQDIRRRPFDGDGLATSAVLEGDLDRNGRCR